MINLEGVSPTTSARCAITWVSDRGGERRRPRATTRWIVGGLALQPGVNVITVTARDAAATRRPTWSHHLRAWPADDRAHEPDHVATYTTSSSTVALTGVASDDSGIARVTWSTDKGQVGDATGTTAWSIPAVTLQLGTPPSSR